MQGTFALYRILSNDLPPRHDEGQTVRNTAFILAHEPPLPGARRIWVVRNILDPVAETKLLELLQAHAAEYIHIPFDLAAYKRLAVSDDKTRLLKLAPLNPVRNRVIAEGQQFADWVLPLDGACIFDAAGWSALTETVARDAAREKDAAAFSSDSAGSRSQARVQ
jgi:hypothetical protein